jgi:ribosomal protein S18 acetylase RimI-like enzyme
MSNPLFTTRPMEISDVEKIRSLLVLQLGDKAESQAQIVKFLRDPQYTRVACNEAGRIIGVILACDSVTRGHIHRIVVLPQYRNQGVGKRLLEEIMEEFNKDSLVIPMVFLRVDTDNVSTRLFFLKNGFRWSSRDDLGFMGVIAALLKKVFWRSTDPSGLAIIDALTRDTVPPSQ